MSSDYLIKILMEKFGDVGNQTLIVWDQLKTKEMWSISKHNNLLNYIETRFIFNLISILNI